MYKLNQIRDDPNKFYNTWVALNGQLLWTQSFEHKGGGVYLLRAVEAFKAEGKQKFDQRRVEHDVRDGDIVWAPPLPAGYYNIDMKPWLGLWYCQAPTRQYKVGLNPSVLTARYGMFDRGDKHYGMLQRAIGANFEYTASAYKDGHRPILPIRAASMLKKRKVGNLVGISRNLAVEKIGKVPVVVYRNSQVVGLIRNEVMHYPTMGGRTSKVLRHSNILCGIELETERWGPADETQAALSNVWTFDADGSLRGPWAMEAISIPLKGTALVGAVRKLCKAITLDVEDAFSYRCSTHIHVNMLDLTPHQLTAFMLTSLLVDNFMFEAGGGERRGNYNCRPVSLMMEEVEGLATLAYALETNKSPKWKHLFNDRNRYYGTNFAALFKFGTCEFRHFPGTQHSPELLRWIDFVGDIYQYAVQNDVMDIYEVSDKGARHFGKQVFGSRFSKYLDYQEAEGDWLEAMDAAYHFINTLQRQEAGRQTFHGFLQAEYVI
jgi:hypothetical protein